MHCVRVLLFSVALWFAPVVAQETPHVEPEITEEELEEAEESEEMREAESELSTEATAALESAQNELEELIGLMVGVVDAATAETYAPRIVAMIEQLRNADFSAFAEEDEELLAAEFGDEVFIRLEAELLRLEDAAYFGNSTLRNLCAGAESAGNGRTSNKETPDEEPDSPVQEAATESVSPENRSASSDFEDETIHAGVLIEQN